MTVIKHIIARTPATTGIVDYRSSFMTETPNAMLVFVTGNNAPYPIQSSAEARISVGCASKRNNAINQSSVGMSSQNGQASSINSSTRSSVRCVSLLDATGTVVDAGGEMVDFLPDNGNGSGVRINWTTLGGTGKIAHMSIVLISCSAAASGSYTSPGGIGSTHTETTNIDADTFVFFSNGIAPVGELEFSLGLAVDNVKSGIVQRCSALAVDITVPLTMAPSHRVQNNRVDVRLNSLTGTIATSQELTAVDSTSFEITQRDGTDTIETFYLALKVFPSISSINDILSRTTLGTQNVTTGYRPQMIIHPVSMAEAFNTAYTDARAGSFGVNIYGDDDADTSQFDNPSRHIGMTMDDAALPTVTNSLSSFISASTTGRGVDAYNDDGSLSASMDYTQTRTGWTLEYFAVPGVAKQWFALSIQKEVIVTNPPVPRMYSLLHGLSLSVLVKPSPLSNINGFTVSDIAFRMRQYSHEIAADGGYLSSSLTFVSDRGEVSRWLKEGVGKELSVFNESQQLIWAGLINSVSISMGPTSLTVGSLLDVVNRLRVLYQTIRYNTNPPVGGQRRITTAAEDEDSQSLFGILEDILNGGESSNDEAAQLRDKLLSEIATLRPKQSISFGRSSSDISITLNCVGYVELMDKYFYSNLSGSGTVNASDKIGDILAADPNSLFNTDGIETNTFQVGDYDDGTNKALTVIKSVTSLGDAADNRYTFSVTGNREVFYRQIPDSIEYSVYVSQFDLNLVNKNGATVNPWNALPGKWVVVPDISYSFDTPGSLSELYDSDQAIFAERVRFTTPYNLEIVGGRVSSINQRLAKLGLGGSF